MKNFTTNWLLYDSLKSRKRQADVNEKEVLSKEIQKKIKLIEKAFH